MKVQFIVSTLLAVSAVYHLIANYRNHKISLVNQRCIIAHIQ